MCISVNSCCCYFTLSVGTKIIAVLSTLSALISVLLYGASALMGSELPPSRQMFYAAMAVTAAVQCVFSCLLIYGAFKHKPKYLVPWAVLAWGLSATLVVLAVTGGVLLSYNRRAEDTAEISTVISAYFVYALVLYYFASVVHSRRQQMVIEGRVDVAKRLMRHRALPNYYV